MTLSSSTKPLVASFAVLSAIGLSLDSLAQDEALAVNYVIASERH